MINKYKPNFMPNTKLLSVPGSAPTSDNSPQSLYRVRGNNPAVSLFLVFLAALLFIGCASSDSGGSSNSDTSTGNNPTDKGKTSNTVLKYYEGNLTTGGQPESTSGTSIIAVKFDLTQDSTVDSASFEVGGAQNATAPTKFQAIIYADNNGEPGNVLDDTQPEGSVPVKTNTTQTVTFNKFLKAQIIWVAMKWVVPPPPNDNAKTQHLLRADSTLDYPNLVSWNVGSGWIKNNSTKRGDMAVKLNITPKPNNGCLDATGNVLKYYDGASSTIQPAFSETAASVKQSNYDENGLLTGGQPQTTCPTSLIAVQFDVSQDATVDSVSFQVKGAQNVTVATKFKAIIYTDNNGKPGTVLDDTQPEGSVPVINDSIQTVTFNKFLNAQKIWVAMKWVVAPPPNDDGKTQHLLRADSKLDYPNLVRWNFGAGWVEPTGYTGGDMAVKLNITPKPNKVVGTCPDAKDVTGDVLRYYDNNNTYTGTQPFNANEGVIAVKFDVTADSTVECAYFKVYGAKTAIADTKFDAIIYADSSGDPGKVLATQSAISVPFGSNTNTIKVPFYEKFSNNPIIWVAMKWVDVPPHSGTHVTEKQHQLYKDTNFDHPDRTRWNFGNGWIADPSTDHTLFTNAPGDMAVELTWR